MNWLFFIAKNFFFRTAPLFYCALVSSIVLTVLTVGVFPRGMANLSTPRERDWRPWPRGLQPPDGFDLLHSSEPKEPLLSSLAGSWHSSLVVKDGRWVEPPSSTVVHLVITHTSPSTDPMISVTASLVQSGTELHFEGEAKPQPPYLHDGELRIEVLPHEQNEGPTLLVLQSLEEGGQAGLALWSFDPKSGQDTLFFLTHDQD